MEPFLLAPAPILKPKIWGGRRLEGYHKPLPGGEMIGESWELADLPAAIEGGRSIIDNGMLAGKTIRSLLEEDPTWIMGHVPLSPDGGFPLLVKYLDARENLSVQVHPDAAWAAAHPEAHLKTESWLVLEAEPGSVIYKGVREGVTPEQFAASIEDGTVVEHLIAMPVSVGECHDLPSGTCHALGAGILVAEIQTPSDTTFRVFDWGRTDRTLHVEQAMQCIMFTPGAPANEPRVLQSGSVRTTLCSQTEHYVIERLDAIEDHQLVLAPDGAPEVLMVLEGRVVLEGSDSMELEQGRTVLLPAAITSIQACMDGGSTMLRITIPGTGA
jgi:mannose-6-phosphate isomerase